MVKRLSLGLVLFLTALWSPIGPTASSGTSGVMFGAFAAVRSGETQQTAVENLEGDIGRPLSAVRVYDRWDSRFPTSYDLWLRNTGHALFLSVRAQRVDGSIIRWRDIANAQPGSSLYTTMVNWATRIKNFDAPVFFIFHHEPETELSEPNGGASDFIDAWRKIVTVFRDQGVTNARYVWTLTGYAFARRDSKAANLWYPGDDYVDYIGGDPYNFYTCRPSVDSPWRSFADIVEPMRLFGEAHPSKGLVLPEWGSVEDSAVPGRKAEWIAGAQATLKSSGWEQFEAVLYWHSRSHIYSGCQWQLDTSQSSLNAFAQMGADPYFNGAGPPSITSFAPTKGRAGTTVTISGNDLTGAQTVEFNNKQAMFSVVSSSEISARVPTGATAGRIEVVAPSGTATSSAPFQVVHPRNVSLKLLGHIRAQGEVAVTDGFNACARDANVLIQRRASRRWRTVATALTRSDGSYSTRMADRSGRYRARTSRRTLATGDICGRATSGKKTHRR